MQPLNMQIHKESLSQNFCNSCCHFHSNYLIKLTKKYLKASFLESLNKGVLVNETLLVTFEVDEVSQKQLSVSEDQEPHGEKITT